MLSANRLAELIGHSSYQFPWRSFAQRIRDTIYAIYKRLALLPVMSALLARAEGAPASFVSSQLLAEKVVCEVCGRAMSRKTLVYTHICKQKRLTEQILELKRAKMEARGREKFAARLRTFGARALSALAEVEQKDELSRSAVDSDRCIDTCCPEGCRA